MTLRIDGNMMGSKGVASMQWRWIRSGHGFEEEDGIEVDMDSKKEMESKWTWIRRRRWIRSGHGFEEGDGFEEDMDSKMMDTKQGTWIRRTRIRKGWI